MEHLILIKRWKKTNDESMEDIYCCICTFYYTFVDDNNFDKIHTYEVVPYQYPLDNIANDLYDLILHLA
jgi:hypothetical protein